MQSFLPTEQKINSITQHLQKEGLGATYDPQERLLNVTTPPTAKGVTTTHPISLAPLLDEQVERRAVTSFAAGVASVLSAPKQVAMQELAFETAAERLLMKLEGPMFLAGVQAVKGDEPLSQPWFDGLCIVYWLDLDRGRRVISRKRFDAWNVSLDQVHCGARSLLFHRSRSASFSPQEGFETLDAVGDGFEGGRILVLEEMDWQRAADGLRCAIPDAHTLLVQPLHGPEEALRQAIHKRFAEAALPLSDKIYVQQGSRFSQA